MKLLLAVASLIVLAACGTSDSGGAEPSGTPASTAAAPTGAAAAVEQLMLALDAGDCEAARRLVVTPSELDCDVVVEAEGSFADEGNDLADATYSAGPAQGSSTSVTIDWGSGNPNESYDVEQVDGRWLVVFDSVA